MVFREITKIKICYEKSWKCKFISIANFCHWLQNPLFCVFQWKYNETKTTTEVIPAIMKFVINEFPFWNRWSFLDFFTWCWMWLGKTHSFFTHKCNLFCEYGEQKQKIPSQISGWLFCLVKKEYVFILQQCWTISRHSRKYFCWYAKSI